MNAEHSPEPPQGERINAGPPASAAVAGARLLEASPAARERRRLRRWGMLLLLAAAVLIRAKGLGISPPPLATADEFHYLWTGLSLLSGCRPVAWSQLAAYEGTSAQLGVLPAADWTRLIAPPFGKWEADPGQDVFSSSGITLPPKPMQVVCPALDHPPLYSLMAGGFAWLTGARPVTLATMAGQNVTLWRVDLARARWLSVLLFAVSFLLLYDLAARRCGYAVAMLAVLLYSTTCHCVLHGRLLVTESLSTPLFLASLCAFERYRLGRWRERTFAVAAVALTAASLLTKVIAVSQGAALIFLLLAAGRRRAALWPVAGAMLGLAIYLAYAASLDWGLFISVMRGHAARFYGFDILHQLIGRQRLIEEESFSTPLFAGWLMMFAIMLGNWRARPALAAAGSQRNWPPFSGGIRGHALVSAGMIFLIAFSYFTSVPEIYGWHVQPFYPFLTLSLAVMFMRVWRRPDPFPFAGLLAVLGLGAFSFIFMQHTDQRQLMRMAYLAVMGSALLAAFVPHPRARSAQRLALLGALAVLLIHQIYAVFVMNGVIGG